MAETATPTVAALATREETTVRCPYCLCEYTIGDCNLYALYLTAWERSVGALCPTCGETLATRREQRK